MRTCKWQIGSKAVFIMLFLIWQSNAQSDKEWDREDLMNYHVFNLLQINSNEFWGDLNDNQKELARKIVSKKLKEIMVKNLSKNDPGDSKGKVGMTTVSTVVGKIEIWVFTIDWITKNKLWFKDKPSFNDFDDESCCMPATYEDPSEILVSGSVWKESDNYAGNSKKVRKFDCTVKREEKGFKMLGFDWTK